MENARDVVGNRRLTAVAGVVLLVLLAAEGVTILRIRQLIGVHVFLGVLLIAPVLLKLVSTGYRFVRYYTGDAAYVRVGPPPIVLRVIGPLVVLLTLAVLASGVMIVLGGRGGWLFLHKASFVAWFIVMTVHVLGHLREALVDSGREFSRRGRGPVVRVAALVLVLVAGVAGATAFYPSALSWTNGSQVNTGNEGH